MSELTPPTPAPRPRRRRWIWWTLGVIAALVAASFIHGIGFVAVDLLRSGIARDAMSRVKKHDYSGTSIDNLRAMHTALMMYHDSEGMFPAGEGWMDAILPRLDTYDLKKGEAVKKLIHPEFLEQKDQYGYAMNEAAALKYKDDLSDPKMPLVFDSKELSRNAHGHPRDLLPNPPRGGGNKGIALDGALLDL